MISDTTHRVPRHTPDHLNERVIRRTRENIARLATEAEEIDRRLQDLDREWDIERMLEANASTLVVLGVAAGYLFTPWLYLVPFLVGAFLLQHALQGWCPPVRLFRRLGFRTHAEIATERYALRILRGDFDDLGEVHGEDPVIRAAAAFRLARW